MFMDDLVDLFRTRHDADRAELIEAWLKGTIADEEGEVEIKRVLQDIAVGALAYPNSKAEPVISTRLPDVPAVKKQLERFLAPLNPSITANELHVSSPAYVRYVQEQHGFPLMRVDTPQQQVLLGINGSTETLTEPLPDGSTVNRALEHIEGYLLTADRGQSPDPAFANTSIY